MCSAEFVTLLCRHCPTPLLHLQVLNDPRFKIIADRIQSVVHDDTHFQKGTLYMRAQKCFCIKSGLNSKLYYRGISSLSVVSLVG